MPKIEISGTPVFLSDEHPEMGVVSPQTLGGTCVGLHLLVEDADATFKRAIAAGGKAIRPMEDEPWGQKSGNAAGPVRASMVRHAAHGGTVGGRDEQDRQSRRRQDAQLK